MLKLKGVLYYK